MTNAEFDRFLGMAIAIWETYDNTYGYVDEKLNILKNAKNNDDWVITIMGMFDGHNQSDLLQLSGETIKGKVLKIYYG